VKIVIDGKTPLDQDMPDLGFDRAYLYLQQTSYNPCKDGTTGQMAMVWPSKPLDQCQDAAHIVHWDNIAFDGPTLPTNALTPTGSEDVVFNVWDIASPVPGSCTVKGVPASPPPGSTNSGHLTFVARLPAGTPVARADISCVASGFPPDGDQVNDIEVVEPGK
jgi:hypothetical protein